MKMSVGLMFGLYQQVYGLNRSVMEAVKNPEHEV